MHTLRLRIPELFAAKGLTPYRVAKLSGGRITLSMAHRLARQQGRSPAYSTAVLEALCDVLGVVPGELFERPAGGR